MLTNYALESLAAHIVGMISTAKYTADDAEYPATIQNATTLGGGKLRVVILVDDMQAANQRITGLRLYTSDGALIVEKTESIVRGSGQDAVCYTITMDVQEGA